MSERDIVERIIAWAKWEPPIGRMPKHYPVPEPVSFEECAAEIIRLRAQLTEERETKETVAAAFRMVDRELTEKRDEALEDAAEIADGQGEPAVAAEIRALKGQKP